MLDQENKNENSEVSQAAESSEDNIASDNLQKINCSKFRDIIKSTYDSRFGEIFRIPVDPERDSVPDYFDVITHPMDLGTILEKIDQNVYNDDEDIINDFRLMISNCLTYNPDGSLAHHHAKELEKMFNKKISRLPRESSTLTPVKRRLVMSSPKKTDSKNKSSKGPKVKKVDPPPVLVPRESTRIAKKTVLKNYMDNEQSLHSPALNYCLQAVNELFHKRHNDYSQAFLSPVDPISLSIPDYYEIVKHPMDFSTVRDKLKSNHYTSPSQFMKEARLVFTNCYRYNSSDSEVYSQALQLHRVFEHFMSICPQDTFHDIHLSNDFTFEESVFNSIRTTRRSNHIESRQFQDSLQNIERKLQLIHDDVVKIKNEKSKHNISGGSENGQLVKRQNLKTITTPTKTPISTILQSRSEPDKLEDIDPMTYDEKLLLSTQIMSLGESKIKEILSIINQKEPWSRRLAQGKDKKENIEIDLDSLAASTLRSIEKYIQSINKRKSENSLRKKCTPEERSNRENDLRKRLKDMESQLAGKAPILLSKNSSGFCADKIPDDSNTNAGRLSDSSTSDISDDEFAKRYSLKGSNPTPSLPSKNVTSAVNVPKSIIPDKNPTTTTPFNTQNMKPPSSVISSSSKKLEANSDIANNIPNKITDSTQSTATANDIEKLREEERKVRMSHVGKIDINAQGEILKTFEGKL